MKRISLISFAVLACLSLSACGTNSKQAKQDSEASSLKIANSKLKKKVNKHSVKKTNNKNSSSATDSSTQQSNQQTQTNHANGQSTSVNNADDAVAAARAKYGDDNGSVHWGYMIDGETGQPIRNADGSYFVKGTADNGTMTGTQYSVNVFPDGTITSN
ncbi:hypothetical protein FD27_GL001216 [Limosilactobacillus frumenti DSM 13145]|uniref:Lipoprotein n=1 Tax=Limosilactobacillus frumenti DSM 13145 TaxID=1423746 RepID=A0A0R1P495_9LACO|nr:hypothetical protein [Limosilactobacillus frumenti]KRL27453.1 hypothetical protein FD27_GL001216 [Limosilactobacillus frumenti DSM 13145]QFG72889.1 hypothetical protein LF145_05890 [Limosilactobacillus frumenti]